MGLAGAVPAQTLRQDAQLLNKPDGAAVGAPLKAGATVKMVKRQGFWVEVDAGARGGWIKLSMLNLSGATGGPTAIDTGRLGTGNIVATSAVRGLSAKDLLNGKPNFDEAAKLEALVVQTQAAQAFLVAGGVTAVAERVQLTAPRSAPVAPAAAEAVNVGGVGVAKKKGDDDW